MKTSLINFFTVSMLVVLTIILLQGCAFPAIPNEPMRFDKDNTLNGLLVGSVTFPTETARFEGYFFRLTNTTSQEFKINRSQKGQLDEGRTYLFALERPAGKSEIPSVKLFHKGKIVGQYDLRIGGFSIPYEIKKGEITYIGNIGFNDYAKKGDTVVSLNNTFERDINELKKLHPAVDWDMAKNDTSRKIEYNNKKARL